MWLYLVFFVIDFLFYQVFLKKIILMKPVNYISLLWLAWKWPYSLIYLKGSNLLEEVIFVWMLPFQSEDETEV